MHSSRLGISIIELIVVIAILGILLAVGFINLPSGGPRTFANDLRGLVQQARYEAVKRNVPVAVVWRPDEREFQTRLSDSAAYCAGSQVLARRSLNEYPRLTITTDFVANEGVVWLPSGQARSCLLTSFAPTIARITDGRTENSVLVTLTGRIEVE